MANSSQIQDFDIRSKSTGALLAAESASFEVWGKRDSAGTRTTPTAPTITANGDGTYNWNPGLSEGESYFGIIDRGANASDRYLPVWGSYEDFVNPTVSGSGTESITLTRTVDGAIRKGAKVTVYDDGGSLAAGPAYTDSAGRVTLLLDAGNYSVRTTSTGASFDDQEIVVSSPNAVDIATQDGTAGTSRMTAKRGLDEVIYATSTLHGEILGVVFGESITVSRTLKALPAEITNDDDANRPKLKIGQVGEAAIRTETASVSDTGADGTGAFSFTLTSTEMEQLQAGADLQYSITVKLDDGTTKIPEVGRIQVMPAVF